MRYLTGGVRRLIGIGLAGTVMVAAASLMPALPASAALAQASAVVSWQRNTSLAPMLIVTSRV